MLKKCKYWRFYKGLKPPSCNCEYCEAKWLRMSKRRAKAALSDDCPDPDLCTGGCAGYCSEDEEETEDVVTYLERNT